MLFFYYFNVVNVNDLYMQVMFIRLWREGFHLRQKDNDDGNLGLGSNYLSCTAVITLGGAYKCTSMNYSFTCTHSDNSP